MNNPTPKKFVWYLLATVLVGLSELLSDVAAFCLRRSSSCLKQASSLYPEDTTVGREWVEAAAIVFEGNVWSLPKPARHHQIIAAHIEQTGLDGSGQQGFLTNKGRFVSRREAARIAYDAGQLEHLQSSVFSEDLW